jgi:hypothetical protein
LEVIVGNPLPKKERRIEAKQRKERSRRRKRVSRLALTAGAILIAAGAATYLVYALVSKPGDRLPDEGADHVDVGTPVTYATNPPTSGPHYADPADPGIYDEPVDDRYLVHSLEHGYVIISYSCAGLDEAACADLRGKLAETAWSEELWKLIVVPRTEMPTPIALTAWTRLQRLEEFDRDAIVRFIDAWRDRGPEHTHD